MHIFRADNYTQLLSSLMSIIYKHNQKTCRDNLRGVLFIVRPGGDIIKAEFMHTKRTNCLTEMKIGIHLEELK